MGYTHGKRWSESEIIKGILGVKDALGTEYMPSKSEMETVTGNKGLSNAVSRYGGVKYFRKLLNLEQKESCSLTGDINEYYIMEILKNKGFYVEKTKPRYPYDLLINGIVKIDVKSANPILSKVHEMNEFVFAINNIHPKCDLFIFVTQFPDGKRDEYIIPSHLIKQTQLGIGETSKYDIYLNKYDYIDKYINLYDQIS